MSFAALMKAQIAKGKPSSPAAPKESSSSAKDSTTTTTATSKYIKGADRESQREAAYRLEQEELARQEEDKYERKRRAEEEEHEKQQEREVKRQRLAEESRRRRLEEEEEEERKRRKRLGLPEIVKVDESEENGAAGMDDGEADMDDAELMSKLRALKEPATLFGEDHQKRLKRYRKLIDTDKMAMSKGPIPTTLKMVPEADMKVPMKVPKDAEGRKYLFRQLASYFSMLLSEWQLALDRRDDDVKTSYQGKAAYTAMVYARQDMTPLFRKMEKGEIEDGVLEPVVEIVRAAQERRYVDANDGYLRLSIGKAAWPIGVTMVGIHERSAREKLHESDNTAHIMSDETTRKYLQSIKRCLSFAQTRWPPDDQLQLMG